MPIPQFYQSGGRWYATTSPYPLPASAVGVGPGGAPVIKVAGQWTMPGAPPGSTGYKQVDPETGQEMGTRFKTPLVTVEDPRRVAAGDSIWSGHQDLMRKQTEEFLKHGAQIVQGGVVHRPGDLAQVEKMQRAAQQQQAYAPSYAAGTALQPRIQIKYPPTPKKAQIGPTVQQVAQQFLIPEGSALTRQFWLCMKYNAQPKSGRPSPCKPTTKYEQCWYDRAAGRPTEDCYQYRHAPGLKVGAVAKAPAPYVSPYVGVAPLPTPPPGTPAPTLFPFGADTPVAPIPNSKWERCKALQAKGALIRCLDSWKFIPADAFVPDEEIFEAQSRGAEIDLPPTTADADDVGVVERGTFEPEEYVDVDEGYAFDVIADGTDFEEEFGVTTFQPVGQPMEIMTQGPVEDALEVETPSPQIPRSSAVPVSPVPKKDNTTAWVAGLGLAFLLFR